MGGAWAVASVGPPGAEWCRNRFGPEQAFAIVAILLASSGLVGLLLSRRIIARVAERDAQSAADAPASEREPSDRT